MSATRHDLIGNDELAATFEEVAGLLETQGANPFRVQAYRNAADTIRKLDEPAHEILRTEGLAGLMALSGVGTSIAHAIEHLVRSGRLPLLERLRGEDAAERVFATVPTIGPGLAMRIHQEMGIETLAELQAAANDGRLARVSGMGSKRVRAVRESLTGRFARRVPSPLSREIESEELVPVSELLNIDDQYRHLAELDRLPRIAPRRFNPTGQAWLPILHTRRDDRHYTALFSNTARAHEFGATHDWVVIYRDDHQDHGRWTVTTAHSGRLRDRRIIRGREHECEAHYDHTEGK
jgi:hypothetical protein